MTMRVRAAAVVAGGAVALFTGAVLAATGGTAAAAGDPTTADLRQSEVTADDPEFDQGSGNCDEKSDQGADEDIWVFVWPGQPGSVELVSLELNFDTDGDGVADTTLTEDDATETTDQGALKVWVTTPAGWTLVDGTSEIVGAVAGQKFNLTHSCAGTSAPGPTPTPAPTEPGNGNGNGNGGNGNGNGGGGNGGGDDNGSEDELPVTGMQVGGLAALGAGLLGAGVVAMLAVRRRRSLPELTEG